MGIHQTANDAVRVLMNGVSMGGWDALEGGDAAAQTAASRDRLGVAGDVLNAATYLVGGVGALKGAKLGLTALRALPKAAPAIERLAARVAAPLGNTARNRFRTRLGMEAIPTFGQKVITGAAAAPRVAVQAVAAHPYKSLGIGGALAFGTATGNNARVTAHQPAAAPAAAPAAPMSPIGGGGERVRVADQLADDFMGSMQSAGAQQPTFAGMADQIAQAQGGQLSLRQLMALSEVAQRSAVKPPKLPTAKDAAGQQYLSLIDAQAAAAQAEAQRLRAAGDEEGAQALWNKAMKERQDNLKVMLGTDPMEDFLAAQAEAQDQ